VKDCFAHRRRVVVVDPKHLIPRYEDAFLLSMEGTALFRVNVTPEKNPTSGQPERERIARICQQWRRRLGRGLVASIKAREHGWMTGRVVFAR